MNIPDVIISGIFSVIILAMGILFKHLISKVTKQNEKIEFDKEKTENKIFNELSILTDKMEKLHNLIMEMKAELPKVYATKDELRDKFKMDTEARTRIHERIDGLYEKKKNNSD